MNIRRDFFELYHQWWNPRPAAKIFIYGGGRWARTWANMLNAAGLSETRICLISPSLYDSTGGNLPDFKVSPHLDTQQDFTNSVIIVANKPKDRVETIRKLLPLNMPVLVEKPVALSFEEAWLLLDMAAPEQCLFPAHSFLFASYLYEFYAAYCEKIASAGHFEIVWADPGSEIRSGLAKTVDQSVPLLSDVWPHIDSVVRIALGAQPTIKRIKSARGGRRIELEVVIDHMEGTVLLERQAETRQRKLTLYGAGTPLTLDFSAGEPAAAHHQGSELLLDKIWQECPGPLHLQFGCFLDTARRKTGLGREISGYARHAAQAIAEPSIAIGNYQKKLMNEALFTDHLSDDCKTALLQQLPDFYETAICHNPFAKEHEAAHRKALRYYAGTTGQSSQL